MQFGALHEHDSNTIELPVVEKWTGREVPSASGNEFKLNVWELRWNIILVTKKNEVEKKVKKCNSRNTQLIIKSPSSIEDSLSTPTVTSSKYQSHIPRCKTKYLLQAPKEVDQGPLIHDDIPRFFCPVLRLKETKIIQNVFLFRKILTEFTSVKW